MPDDEITIVTRNSLATLKSDVAMLAAPAGEQIEYLSRARLPVDELFLSLGDVVDVMIELLVEQTIVTEEIADRVRHLFERMHDPAVERSAWTSPGLRESKFWISVRAEAATLLDLLRDLRVD